MKRYLILYPNCSKGGVTTVIRNRAFAEPDAEFFAVFAQERGGLNAFDDLSNVQVRIVPEKRMSEYVQFLSKCFDLDEVAVLSLPKVANEVTKIEGLNVHYEFHSPDLDVIKTELAFLDNGRVTNMFVPSSEMKEMLSKELPEKLARNIAVKENLLNKVQFSPVGDADRLASLPPGRIPLLWVGRLDWQKGAYEFLQTLASVGDFYDGYMVFSLERDSEKMGTFLAEAELLGLRDRLHIFMDLPQGEIASLFRSVAASDGVFVSTSNAESFGYAVLEAISCGVKVAAFDLPVPVWAHLSDRPDVSFTPLGEVAEMSKSIRALTQSKDS